MSGQEKATEGQGTFHTHGTRDPVAEQPTGLDWASAEECVTGTWAARGARPASQTAPEKRVPCSLTAVYTLRFFPGHKCARNPWLTTHGAAEVHARRAENPLSVSKSQLCACSPFKEHNTS